MLDPQSDRALYRQLADLLRSQITSGALLPGSKLPSETSLAQEYGLARPAVRNAIAILRAEGLVKTEKGFGTRVRQHRERDTVRVAPGDVVTCRMPTESERRRLDIDDGVPVLVVHRGHGGPELYAGDRVQLIA